MNAADLIAHASAELDAIMARSSSPTVDQKAAALKVLLAAEVPALAPTIVERRSGHDRRQVDRPDTGVPMIFSRRTGPRRTSSQLIGLIADQVAITSDLSSLPGLQPTLTYQATAVATNRATGSIVVGSVIAWSTGNPAVATVDTNTGLLTAVGNGSTVLRATLVGANIFHEVAVTVVSTPVADHLTVTPPTITIDQGQSTAVTAVLYDSAGNPMSGRAFTAASGTPSVATVGTINTAADPAQTVPINTVSAGSAVITVTDVQTGLSDTTDVTVNAVAGTDFPNLPSGYTLISDVVFDDVSKKPIASTSQWDANRWQITRGTGRLTIGSASAVGCPGAPFGDTVLRGLFPLEFNSNGTGGWSGTSPFVMTMQFANPEVLYQNVYYAIWLCEQTGWINTAGAPCAGPKFGFWNPSATTNGPKLHQFMSFQTDSPYTTTENRLKMAVSSVGPAGLVDWQVLAPDNSTGYMSVGAWHKLEILTQSGTPGVADGRVRCWMDGALKFDRTDVIDPPGAPKPGYRGVDWNPTVCGVPWPADQYMCVARWAVYVSN